MTELRDLAAGDISMSLFSHFNRHQTVTRCWRKREQGWRIEDIAFTDDWSAAEYAEVIAELYDIAHNGGLVKGAFVDGEMKGFVSVSPKLIGSRREYADLTFIIVSEDARGKGIGSKLFNEAVIWARAHGAGKLYISAHSSVESQSFYNAMGCREAEEYSREHVEKEPCDCQLEYVL